MPAQWSEQASLNQFAYWDQWAQGRWQVCILIPGVNGKTLKSFGDTRPLQKWGHHSVCWHFVTLLPRSLFTYTSSPITTDLFSPYNLSPAAPLWSGGLIWFSHSHSHFLFFPSTRSVCCSWHTGRSPTAPRRSWREVQIDPEYVVVCESQNQEAPLQYTKH